MLRLPVLAALAASLAALVPATAHAFICYMVLDKGGSAIYRDQLPPVDMSAAGAPARDQLRQRGELLIIMDTDKCQQILPVRAGSLPLTADQVLADAPSMRMGGGGPAQSVPVSSGSSGRGIAAPMPADTRPAVASPAASIPAALRSGSSAMRY